MVRDARPSSEGSPLVISPVCGPGKRIVMTAAASAPRAGPASAGPLNAAVVEAAAGHRTQRPEAGARRSIARVHTASFLNPRRRTYTPFVFVVRQISI